MCVFNIYEQRENIESVLACNPWRGLYIYIIVKFCLCHSGVSGCTATDNPCYSKFLLECDKRVVDQDGMTISHVFRLSPWHKHCRKRKVINWPTDSILSVETWHFVIKSLFPGSFDVDMSASGTYEAGGGQHGTAIGTKTPPFSRWVRRWEIYLKVSTKILFDSGKSSM